MALVTGKEFKNFYSNKQKYFSESEDRNGRTSRTSKISANLAKEGCTIFKNRNLTQINRIEQWLLQIIKTELAKPSVFMAWNFKDLDIGSTDKIRKTSKQA